MREPQDYFENWMEENQHEYDNIPIENLLEDYLADYKKEAEAKMPSDELRKELIKFWNYDGYCGGDPETVVDNYLKKQTLSK